MQIDRLARELRHLKEGPSLDEKPAGMGMVRFVARCEGNSSQILAKAKTVLEKIDKASLHEWPSDSAWSKNLPEWFLARCAPELSQEKAEAELARRKSLPPEEQKRADDEWSLLNWIYWFQLENRKWFWWDAEERDAITIVIVVEVDVGLFLGDRSHGCFALQEPLRWM